MVQPFLGEVRPFGCNFAPQGWALCIGQTLPIQQYTALFSLLGTNYGGNGTSNFGLPDLRSRVPMKYGTSPAGTYYIGQQGGEELVQMTSATMPVHTHTFSGTSATGGRSNPATGAALGTSSSGGSFYGTATSTVTPINVGTVSLYGGGNQPHTNIQPYQAINWCIALSGIFPSRN